MNKGRRNMHIWKDGGSSGGRRMEDTEREREKIKWRGTLFFFLFIYDSFFYLLSTLCCYCEEKTKNKVCQQISVSIIINKNRDCYFSFILTTFFNAFQYFYPTNIHFYTVYFDVEQKRKNERSYLQLKLEFFFCFLHL